MTPWEQGFLLLCSHLGDPERKPLTTAQLRNLTRRVQASACEEPLRELQAGDLAALGYDRKTAERILALLEQTQLLDRYVQRGRMAHCVPICRTSAAYPPALQRRMGLDSPGCLWAKGSVELLCKPGIALVGSRELRPLNEAFAWEVGRQAGLQGLVLISGNARGADRTAQEACLEHGGQVICVVADSLTEHPEKPNILYLCEDSFDFPFSPQRALSRNRIIHSLGIGTLAAQCTLGQGGTWDGSVKNLKNRWSPLYCLADGSPAMEQLIAMGATPVTGVELLDLRGLKPDILPMIGQ